MTTLINLVLLLATSSVKAANIFVADFETTTGGFLYGDNAFRRTSNNTQYASGKHVGGMAGVSSYLQVELGGVDTIAVTNGMSGGWSRNFVVPAASAVSIFIDYRLLVGADYDATEFSQVLCSIDGALLILNGMDYIVQVVGDGSGGNDTIVGYTAVTLTSPVLTAGTHRISIGGYNNKKTTRTKLTQIRFDKVRVSTITVAATGAPVKLPTRAPIQVPVKLPVRAPTAATPVQNPFAIRISSGADANFMDSNGVTWEKDQFFGNKGGIFVQCPVQIAGTTLDSLYCKERYFNIWQHAQPFRYDIPVPRSGQYTVKLHFAETYHRTVGSRVFDVWAGGNLAVKGLDIFAEVGYETALVVSTVVQITTNGIVSIEFVPKIENPKICAIEVIENTTPIQVPVKPPTRAPIQVPVKLPVKAPTTTTPAQTQFAIRISSAADANFVDPNGVTWEKDQFFGNKGGIFVQCPVQIAGTTLDSLYCKERYFNIWQHAQPFRYDIPVPRSGQYTVKLHFAETYHRTVGSRVFDVWAGGKIAVKGLDIFAEVGYETALVVTTVVQITTNGIVSIEFVPKIENPKICAIEVIENTTPIQVPVKPPTRAPIQVPVKLPVQAAPVAAPVAVPVATRFDSVLINCGGNEYVESGGVRTWSADKYFIGGSTYSDGSNGIDQTVDDWIYQSERNGEFRYEIPVPVGSYEIVLHFTELFWQGIGQRLFNIMIEDEVAFKNVDMVKFGGGSRLRAFTLETPATIIDGFISIAFSSSNPKMDSPSVAAIEVNFLEPHLAHSVANGPYVATDISDIGRADVTLDGSFAHSHATGATIVQWTWKEGSTVIGVRSSLTLSFSVGIHTVTLTIKDSLGNESTDTTTITVNPFGYPAITGLAPVTGGVAGGQKITIKGAGFNQISSIFFGKVALSGASINILNQFTIEVIAPPTIVAVPVSVTVKTSLGTSNAMVYTYQSSSPINFTSSILTREIASPTSAAFGPDGLLYVGTLYGTLARIQLDSSYTQVMSTVTSTVAPYRAILGIAFDPLQTSGLSDVFITTSFFFHKSPLSSGGLGINGNVKKISGANLDIITDIVTGLPVSDHDHGLTGLEYGDNGEIYIQAASNTNGGIPGRLTSLQVQKDNYYSSATVVAYLADPLFNGAITYTAEDDGIPNGGRGVEVFASGTRNPFGICLHSNGNLYASDNGPNFSYGDMMTGCQPGESKPDVTEGDKINLLVKGGYYGAPNKIRALADKDPRQCVWRSQYEKSDGGYTASILNTESSTDGLIEFHGDHFEKQLRGNLIAAKYQGSLMRIILTQDGKGVIPQSDPAITLTPDVDALDVTQAPDGTLISTSLDQNALYFHKPIEVPTTKLQIKSVYPRRGGQIGGNKLLIFGENFLTVTSVLVGGRDCKLTLRLTSRLECTMPGGSGTVNIVANGNDGKSYNFERGYRYVTGLPL